MHRNSNELTSALMLTLSNVRAYSWNDGAAKGAAGFDQTIAYGQRKIVNIFGTARDG